MTATLDAPQVTITPWLDDQRLMVCKQPLSGSSFEVGDLAYFEDGNIKKVLNRRVRTSDPNWQAHFYPVHRWMVTEAVDANPGLSSRPAYDDIAFAVTTQEGYMTGDVLGNVFRGNASGYLVSLMDHREKNWHRAYHATYRASEAVDIQRAIAARAFSYWGSTPEPGAVMSSSPGLVVVNELEWFENQENATTEDVVIDGFKVTTRRVPVEPRLKRAVYAEKDFLVETARDYATRNSRLDTLNRMLRGERVEDDEGNVITWKNDLVTLDHEGSTYVSLDSLSRFAKAGRRSFGWCAVADEVVTAVRRGKVMKQYRALMTWTQRVRTGTEGPAVVQWVYLVDAYSVENAGRLAEDRFRAYLSEINIPVDSGTVGRDSVNETARS